MGVILNKILFFIFLSSIFVFSSANCKESSIDEFQRKYIELNTNQDVNGLFKLYYKEGIPKEQINAIRELIIQSFEHEIYSIEISKFSQQQKNN